MGKYIELKAEYVREEVEGGIRISRRKVGRKRNVTEFYYQYLLDYLL